LAAKVSLDVAKACNALMWVKSAKQEIRFTKEALNVSGDNESAAIVRTGENDGEFDVKAEARASNLSHKERRIRMMTNHTEEYSRQFEADGQYEDLSKEALLNLMMGPWYKEQMQVESEWHGLVTEKFGFDIAKQMNPLTWVRIAPKAIRWLREATGITGNDVVSFARLVNYDLGFPRPLFDRHWEFKGPNHGILTVDRCRGMEAHQKESAKRGYDLVRWLCQEYDPQAFGAYAAAVNPKMKITPLKLPPQRPGEPACQWEFKIEE